MNDNVPFGSVRSMTERDLGVVFSWRNHPDVRRYMYTQHEISWEEHSAWFERSTNNPLKHLLIYEENTQPLGFINFTESATGRVADWGFYLAPHAARGTGARLGFSALNYGFHTLRLHKVCGQVIAHNERSIAFHRRLGFKQEGVLRDQYYDGQRYLAVYCFGLICREWQADL